MKMRDVWEIAASMPNDFSAEAYGHFCKSCMKHPFFADMLFTTYEKSAAGNDQSIREAESDLEDDRNEIFVSEKTSTVEAWDLMNCEMNEAYVSHLKGDTANTISELYDAIAVIMRMIAVLEEKQSLGRNSKQEEK